MGSQTLVIHPKYKELAPEAHESAIAYALRCAAHLVSPPQEDGENNEFECTDVAAKILSLTDEIERLWGDWQTHYRLERARIRAQADEKDVYLSIIRALEARHMGGARLLGPDWQFVEKVLQAPAGRPLNIKERSRIFRLQQKYL